MFKEVTKEGLKFFISNLFKIVMIYGMTLSLIMICVVIPLLVFESNGLFRLIAIFVLPLVVCSLSTYLASLMRENDNIYNSFLLFTSRYVRNITVMAYIIYGMLLAPLAYIFRDIFDEIMQVPVIGVAGIISAFFIFKYRYIHLVLAENPNMSVIRIFKKNTEITKGFNIKRILISLSSVIIPGALTAIAYIALKNVVNPYIVLAVGGSITYLIKEVIDIEMYRKICGHVYLQFEKVLTLEAAKNSNHVQAKSQAKDNVVKETVNYNTFLTTQINNGKYNNPIKLVEKYEK